MATDTVVGAADAREVPVIEFDGVSLTYPGPPEVQALRRTDLRVFRGEYMTIVGPSGSGKSTFLNVAGLLDRPTGGRYLLDGVDTGELPESRRAALRGARIGFVFQSFHLLPHRSAIENVELSMVYQGIPRAERLARAHRALVMVGLRHRVRALPSTMSGGERQRVAIARALAGRPALMLCDEPTGNLDSTTAEDILVLLDYLNSAGMTIMLITHDPSVAARGTRTVAIRDGLLTEQARPWAPA
ncbi:ABC transporter ATP-binding protein [Streptodolium elevatio]|uniref:ABC transporter ATP-binding protein n=1 Tax=Streptodolium elevatio TaxID=3157996 RepID=A0ABV3DI76_9ACTN